MRTAFESGDDPRCGRSLPDHTLDHAPFRPPRLGALQRGGGGIVFGILAWRTRSIVPGLLLHAAIGLGTDGLIVLKGAGLL